MYSNIIYSNINTDLAADINSGGLLTLMAKILRGGEDSPGEASDQGGTACRGGAGHHHPQCQLLVRTTQRHRDFWKGIHNIYHELYSRVLYKLSFSWRDHHPKLFFLTGPSFKEHFAFVDSSQDLEVSFSKPQQINSGVSDDSLLSRAHPSLVRICHL